MCMCLFAYIDTCTHRDFTCFTNINLCMFAKPYTHMYTCYLHRCIHANMLAYKHAASHSLHTYISPYLLECLYAYMHTCMRMHLSADIYAFTYIHTQSNKSKICAHTHCLVWMHLQTKSIHMNITICMYSKTCMCL